MLSAIAKLMLISTAMAPVLLTYAWVEFKSDKLSISIILIILSLFLIAVCTLLLNYARKNLEKSKFSITSVEAADKENIEFLLLYLFPLFSSSFDALNWDFGVPAIIIFVIVIVNSYTYYFNPLMGLLKWHFYKVGTAEGTTYILVTKKQIQNASETTEIVQLTEYVVIDIGGTK